MHTSADSRSLAKCALIGRFAACYARLRKDWGRTEARLFLSLEVRTKGSGGSNIYLTRSAKISRRMPIPPGPPASSSFSLPFDLYRVCDLSFSSCASSSKMYWFMKAVTRPFLAVSHKALGFCCPSARLLNQHSQMRENMIFFCARYCSLPS
jgi:hypothetical protein